MSEKRDDNTKDGGETEDEREENTLGRDWWYRVPLKHLLRVYDLMKRQGTRKLPLGVDSDSQPRECCPICGREFEEVHEANLCNHGARWITAEVFTPEELITSDDDYAWCE